MRRFVISVAAGLLAFAATPARAAGDIPVADISVMTQNQYLGADLAPLLTMQDPAAFNAAVVAVLRQIAANDYPARAGRLAHEIAKRRPHLVALQEVWAFQCIDLLFPPIPGKGCTDPSIAGAFNDHLAGTMAALSALEAPYGVVAQVDNLDLRDITVTPPGIPGVPFFIDGVPALLRALDRDVILARNDVAAAPAAIPCARPSAEGCNFQTVLQVPVPVPGGGTLPLERGFVAVDATVGGTAYRFVNTHLEVHDTDPANALFNVFQAAQAGELIQTLALTTPAGLTPIVAGDINSSPDHAPVPGPLPLPPPFDQGIVTPYMMFVGSGYIDSWTMLPDARPGYTCCQFADLSNRTTELFERIDMVFALVAPSRLAQASVLGDSVGDKTRPPGLGLWPSDHGALAVGLDF